MSTKHEYDDIDRKAEERLTDKDFDKELAKRMARDARKVSNGELAEAEFHERYREEVEEEFDLNVPEYKQIDMKAQALGAQSQSRRSVLMALGAAGGVAAAGGAGFKDATTRFGVGDGDGTVAAQETGGDDDRRVGMVIDTETCIKCLQCMEACKEENAVHEGDFWMEVFRYQREDKEYAADDEVDEVESLQRPCMHCEDAPCVSVCPNNSRFLADDGRVLCDYNTCLGCEYCEVACPYHVNSFVHSDQPDGVEFVGETHDEEGRWMAGPPPEGSCSKCTYCSHRMVDPTDPDENGNQTTTACEDVCPVDAIHFGDRNDEEGDPQSYLRQRTEEDGAGTFELRTDASNPMVTYIGESPEGVETVDVPGPTTREDVGLEETSRH